MKAWTLKRFLGLFLLAISLTTITAVYVYPYSKLWGKGKIEFEPPLRAEESLAEPPVLPVFGGLRGGSEAKTPGQVFLTIGKLGVKKVPVRLDIFVDNVRADYLNVLLTSLAHLKGTAYPGQKGNSVIFGHSALPYLYSPRNLQTIFTRLDELKFGDLIIVDTDSRVLKFQVEKGGLLGDRATIADLTSRKPRLTLLTCYPPGYKSFTYAVRALLLD